MSAETSFEQRNKKKLVLIFILATVMSVCAGDDEIHNQEIPKQSATLAELKDLAEASKEKSQLEWLKFIRVLSR